MGDGSSYKKYIISWLLESNNIDGRLKLPRTEHLRYPLLRIPPAIPHQDAAQSARPDFHFIFLIKKERISYDRRLYKKYF